MKRTRKIRKDEYESPNERPVKIKVKTDGSGNNTSNEWFLFRLTMMKMAIKIIMIN